MWPWWVWILYEYFTVVTLAIKDTDDHDDQVDPDDQVDTDEYDERYQWKELILT